MKATHRSGCIRLGYGCRYSPLRLIRYIERQVRFRYYRDEMNPPPMTEPTGCRPPNLSHMFLLAITQSKIHNINLTPYAKYGQRCGYWRPGNYLAAVHLWLSQCQAPIGAFEKYLRWWRKRIHKRTAFAYLFYLTCTLEMWWWWW